MTIAANNPNLRSWIEVSPNSDFPIQNLPFGVFKTSDLSARVCTRIGDQVIDLKSLFVLGYFENLPFEKEDFQTSCLNNLMRYGKNGVRDLRNRLSKLFDANFKDLQNNAHHIEQILVDHKSVEMLLPVQVGDYTDFYSSKEHATNVGTMFRDPNNALLPNWLWLPVGYHGRSSSIITSGHDIHRPMGQTRPDENADPVFGPSKLVDFELEMAFITFDGKPLGQRISTEEAEDYIFGLCLFNDWSARDIQKWEYVTLGPFLAKNFASSISPWIVTLDALEPFCVDNPKQEPQVLPYLKSDKPASYDIHLQVAIQPENQEETQP
jgi:fumarylacetoacetase